MATRFRKYFEVCKPVKCTGRRSKACPETPKRVSGEYKVCGTWVVEFFDDNKRWQSLTFPDVRNKSDAEKRLSLLVSDRERGQLNLPRKKVVPTLKEYSTIYMERFRTAKENTRSAKKRSINSLVKHLGEYRLDKITPFIIEKFRIQRKEEGRVKDGTINDDVAILNHVLGMAIQSGLLDKNPCHKVKRLKVTQTRDRVLSPAETALLMDRLQGKDRLMVLLGLFTGLRLGGILGLRWDDIDFERKLVTSSHKTGKLVSIPISDYLLDGLRCYQEANRGDKIFESRETTGAVIVRYSTHFSNLFKSLGIQNFTFHNLRHTFASLLQGELGVGAIIVQNMTGHSSLSMLQRYSHTGLDDKQKAIRSLTDYVLGLKGCGDNTGLLKIGTA